MQTELSDQPIRPPGMDKHPADQKPVGPTQHPAPGLALKRSLEKLSYSLMWKLNHLIISD